MATKQQKQHKGLLAQMTLTFVVTEEEAVGRFKPEMAYGVGTYGALKDDDEHFFYCLLTDDFGNQHWEDVSEDAVRLNAYLVWKSLE